MIQSPSVDVPTNSDSSSYALHLPVPTKRTTRLCFVGLIDLSTMGSVFLEDRWMGSLVFFAACMVEEDVLLLLRLALSDLFLLLLRLALSDLFGARGGGGGILGLGLGRFAFLACRRGDTKG